MNARLAIAMTTLIACAPLHVAEAPVVPAGTVERERPAPVHTRSGAAFDIDQLDAVSFEPSLRDIEVPFAERLAIARRLLGAPGEPVRGWFGEGVAFAGIGGATPDAPWSCFELVIAPSSGPNTSWVMQHADHPRCGLPFFEGTRVPARPEPKLTLTRLRQALAKSNESEVEGVLGPPTRTEPEPTWLAIGPRGRDTPITCHALTMQEGKASIAEAPLATCGYRWPPPDAAFEPGDVPRIDRESARTSCLQRCGSVEACRVEERVPEGATIREEPEGPRAYRLDGKPVPTELVPVCATR